MRWIWQYTIYTYIKQRYHRLIIGIVALVFVFSYILSWLSPADADKIFIELSVSILEILCVLWALVLAVVTANKRHDTTTHMICSQWLSYMQIFAAHRSVGVTMLLYVCIVMCTGLFLTTWFGIISLGIGIISLYVWLKIVLLYTIVFALAHHITPILAAASWLALYILFYSIWLLQSRSGSIHYIAQSIIDILIYILPEFISIGQNIIHIDRLSANIFTIVMSYGIYILSLLLLGMYTYEKVRRK